MNRDPSVGHLGLTLKPGESVLVGDGLEVEVRTIRRGHVDRVVLIVHAPRDLPITRRMLGD